MICTPNQMLFRFSDQEVLDGWSMWHIRGRTELRRCFLGKHGRKTPIGDFGIYWSTVLKWIINAVQ